MLLDTATVRPDERAELIGDVFGDLGIRCSIHHERADTGVYARLEGHDVGVASTFTYAGSGTRIVQTVRQARGAPVDVLAVALQGRRPAVYTQFGAYAVVQPGELLLIDRTAPFDYRWHGDGGALSINLPITELGVSVETVRRASGRLAASPVHDLVKGHIQSLCADAARLAGGPGASPLGDATAELVRALILTAASAEHAVRRSDANPGAQRTAPAGGRAPCPSVGEGSRVGSCGALLPPGTTPMTAPPRRHALDIRASDRLGSNRQV